jgi:hypothetical protein
MSTPPLTRMDVDNICQCYHWQGWMWTTHVSMPSLTRMYVDNTH